MPPNGPHSGVSSAMRQKPSTGRSMGEERIFSGKATHCSAMRRIIGTPSYSSRALFWPRRLLLPPASSSTPQHVLRKVNDLHHLIIGQCRAVFRHIYHTVAARQSVQRTGSMAAYRQCHSISLRHGPQEAPALIGFGKAPPAAAGWPGGGYIAPTQPGAVGRAGTAVQRSRLPQMDFRKGRK